MFGWLFRLFESRPGGVVPPLGRSYPMRVTFDTDRIFVWRVGTAEEALAWSDIASVGLVSGELDREPADLYWLIQGRDRRRVLFVPMGAPGEHELVHEMQVRLSGFDNMAVVEAMSAEGSVGFKVWDDSWPRGGGGGE